MIRHFTRTLAAVFAIALGLSGCASDHGATSATAGGSLSSMDRQFVTMAAQASWAEIATGELAQKNGASEAVRQYGQRMVQDHGMANKELEAIAGKLGMTPPREPDAKHQADAKKLASLSGSDFDRQYGSHMVMDHEMTIALFEKQAKAGADASLRGFASKQLPILQEHLKMARTLPGAR
jgi:putative membrane protein